MKITIVGGGNIGTQFAVHCSSEGHDVIMYTSSPALFDTHLCTVDEFGETTHEGDIRFATSDPSAAFSDADMIIVTVPSTLMQSVANTIYAHSTAATTIGVVPGNGGSECAFRKCIERGNVFFGIERVPAVARLIQKGKTVKSTGYRDTLHVASIPGANASACADVIQSIFDINTQVIPGYLNLTMTPSNPILHTTRLYSLFHNWEEGTFYDSIPLFYEDWDDESSELLFACDAEVQTICKALSDFRLEYVRSLRDHYESPTIESMTKKISSISAFKGLTTPAIKTDFGWIPDLHSRYFTADFSFGLTIIKQIANFANVHTPCIDKVLNWYHQIAIEKTEFHFDDYGIHDLMDLKAFYLQ